MPARLDIYLSIHKALRAFLSDTLVRLGRLDVDDAVDREEALLQLEQALDFVVEHLRHEDVFVHPAIEARQPAGADRVGHEHVEHLAAIARLRCQAALLRGADAAAQAHHLYLEMARLIADTYEHLHYEETTLNPLLWQLYSDEEIGAIHQRLLDSISPSDMLLTLRWAMPAGSPAERAGIVAGMRTAMPPEALMSVLAMVRTHLDPAGWTKLASAAGVSARLMDPIGP
jgi:hemerythrin-like domain-containing protein